MLETFISHSVWLQLNPDLPLYYTDLSGLVASILDPKIDNFYFIYNLPKTSLYNDSYYNQISINFNYFDTKYYLFNLYSDYIFSLVFDRDLQFTSWIKTCEGFLYHTESVDFLISANQSKNVMVFFGHLTSELLDLNWFLNQELVNNLTFLKNLSLFSNTMSPFVITDESIRNLDLNGFYFQFLTHNTTDYKIFCHTLFSTLWPLYNTMLYDDTFLFFSGFISDCSHLNPVDVQYFSTRSPVSSELAEGYYKNRFGGPDQTRWLTEYGYFQVENNYITAPFLSKKDGTIEYLDNIMQYHPLSKKQKSNIFTDQM